MLFSGEEGGGSFADMSLLLFYIDKSSLESEAVTENLLIGRCVFYSWLHLND